MNVSQSSPEVAADFQDVRRGVVCRDLPVLELEQSEDDDLELLTRGRDVVVLPSWVPDAID